MRLDFNVLWVDDQPARVDAQIKAIARRMESEGFNFSYTICESIDQVRPLLAENVFSDEVDLILVDWDLGGGVYGEQVIFEVREKIRYKDVVFYSAQTPPEKLRRLAYEAELEGVYCSDRDGLLEEVIGVFESLVKKVLDLDHTRGIVMGATSDIDDMVNQCLIAIHGKLDEAEQQAFVVEAIGLVETRISALSGNLAALRTDSSVVSLLDAHFLFTAHDRLRTLARTLKHELFNGHATARKAVISYMEKVVPERNILGHQILTPQGKPTAVVNASGKQITLDELRYLRCTILALRTEFRALVKALQA